MNTNCGVPDCERPHIARGWCRMHYDRARNGGDMRAGRINARGGVESSLAFHVKKEGDCLVWTAFCTPSGYGKVNDGTKWRSVHRVAWELENGTIPDGLEVDHICHRRNCLRIDHLRLANRQENCRNRSGQQPGRRQDLPRNVNQKGSKYQAHINVRGKFIYGGIHDTVDEASAAAKELRARYFGNFAGSARRKEQS